MGSEKGSDEMDRVVREPATKNPFNNSDEIFRREIPSRLDAREKVIQDVLEALEEKGYQPDPYFDRLFLDEIISNAIIHGNREDPAKTVTVRAFCDEKRWGFEIADQGKGFGWKAFQKNLDKNANLFKSSGRGLQLVYSSGSEILFLDGGRRIIVVRPRPP